MTLFRRLVLIAAVFAIFSSCGKVGEEVFGDWWPYDREGATKTQKGSSWQILEERGDFSLFLQALELTDYRKLVEGAGLVTIFAPTNAAFKEYLLEEYNTADLNLINQTYPDELSMLVGYHLIQFAYSTDDFLAFSVSSTSDKPQVGDGSVFRYKTYARKPIVETKDPVNRRPVQIYHREEYLPVMSTKLFKTKGIADAEADYKALFPDVNWIDDTEDRIYVGNAAVTEMGIPSDNGYLYIIDKVADPLPTIYEALSDSEYADFNEKYSYIARVFQTLSLYQYNASISTQYAAPGDSLYYHYSFKAPLATAEMPEIASEWTYHNEQGSDITKSMSWAITAVIPTNDVFEAWMREYFSEWFTDGGSVENVIDQMPYITLYQIAIAHLFDKRQIILPSELYSKGVSGAYAETFTVAPEDVQDIKFCSNGIIYGVNHVNEPVIFNSYVAPLFQTNAVSGNENGSTYNVYATAFMSRDMYKVAADMETKYTLFVINDTRMGQTRESENLLNPSWNWSHTDQYRLADDVHGDSFIPGILKNSNTSAENDGSNGDFINRALVYGEIPNPAEVYTSEMADAGIDYLRYYQTRQEDQKYGMYIFSYNGNLYDQCYNKVDIYDIKQTPNGIFYEVGQRFQAPSGGINAVMTRQLGSSTSQWKSNLLTNCDLGQSTGMQADFNVGKDYIMFALSDAAIERGLAQGLIPRYDKTDQEISPEEHTRLRKLLRDYCAYYIINKNDLDLSGYIFPGYGPDGPTNERFEVQVKTCVEYTNILDAKYITIIWDPEDPLVLTLRDYSGKEIKTRKYTTHAETGEQIPSFPDTKCDNGILYVIDDDVFDYNTMFVEQ